MIKAEKITELEKTLRLPEGTLKSAIEAAEEKDIEIPSLKIYTEEEETARIENERKTAREIGVEIAIKGAKNKFGLQFEGKTIDNLLENYSKKVIQDANISPDKKVQELTSDLEKLRGINSTIENQFNEFKATVIKKEGEREIDSLILTKIPQNTTIPTKDVLHLFKYNFQAEKNEGGIIEFKKDGVVLKNEKTLNPLTAEEVINSFVTPYLKKPEGGAGGGDEAGGGKPGTLQAFSKEMADRGVREGSLEFNQEMQKRIKEKTLSF